MIVFPEPSGTWPASRVCETDGCYRKASVTTVQLAVFDGAVAVPTFVCLGCKQPMARAEWSDL